MDTSRLIYLPGLESTGNSGKARLFREWFPGMLTPDFTGSFDVRMTQLQPIISDTINWTIIGSSFGGLMGASFTIDHPAQIRKLVLVAPALMLEPFASQPDPSTGSGQRPQPVSVPTIIIHGTLIP